MIILCPPFSTFFSRVILAPTLLCCIALVAISPCRAQAPEAATSREDIDAPKIEAEGMVDLRARVPGEGKTFSNLHSAWFSLRTSDGVVPGGLRVNMFGMNQYGAYRWQQVALEKELSSGKRNVLPQRLQAGIIRVPFGIYDYRETYGSGLIDYPMPRLDYAFNAVDWGAPGVQWTGGTSAIQVEAAGLSGTGMGVWGNLDRLNGGVVRLQTYAPPGLVIGASGWVGNLETHDGMKTWSKVDLGGVDMRYTLSHLLLRGEVLAGTLAGSRTKGAYLDMYYRLPKFERVTLVARGEALKPDDAQPQARQLTVGGRLTMGQDWIFAANWRCNNMRHSYKFTWTPATNSRGDFLFQVMRRFSTHQ